jgi:1,4-dihydroxy-2-naphthoate octaprenyltransferase
VILGVAVAAHLGRVNWYLALAALGVAVALQFGVNYANDYSDFRRGADREGRLGPPRAAASGLVPPRLVLAAAVASFAVAAVLGLLLAALTSWWLVALGAVCILAAIGYTGGPVPYGYRGYGELAVFIFFGLVATVGTEYVVSGRIDLLALLAGILPGSLAAALLMVNNLRDLETDRAVGKRTLAVILGARGAFRAFLVMVGISLCVPLLIAIPGIEHFTVFLPWLLVPVLEAPVRNASSDDPQVQIRALKQMGAILLFSSILLAVGIWTG